MVIAFKLYNIVQKEILTHRKTMWKKNEWTHWTWNTALEMQYFRLHFPNQFTYVFNDALYWDMFMCVWRINIWVHANSVYHDDRVKAINAVHFCHTIWHTIKCGAFNTSYNVYRVASQLSRRIYLENVALLQATSWKWQIPNKMVKQRNKTTVKRSMLFHRTSNKIACEQLFNVADVLHITNQIHIDPWWYDTVLNRDRDSFRFQHSHWTLWLLSQYLRWFIWNLSTKFIITYKANAILIWYWLVWVCIR